MSRAALATWAKPAPAPLPFPTDRTYTGDIDWIAIERAITHDHPRVQLTRDEQLTATLLLIRAGWTEKDTAEAVGVDKRQIARWKYENGLGAARTCTLDDCGDQIKARGLCYRHYRQHERKRKAAARPTKGARRREPAACGTRPGYKRHHREGTPVCEPCQTANANYGTDRYHATKEAA
ncbi:hypothetical protein NLX86_19025 [Streptomyces sp. A3M-1-3]|uniref:hypothetical protein n=1 Tax=Streptomyces sp. A3M-1-3 TaxID=2962044 RepID=UPI0020B79C60|nr:hypothetical protein [Streptomyces sp. A3M-1-3]MCP3820112.1 hypothetical protein [Streptomyces sp. A3M-1-3]